MVETKGGEIKPLGDIVKKKVKVGNDSRQFILRIPTKISDNSILKSFDKGYTAEVKIDIKKPNQIIIDLKKNG